MKGKQEQPSHAHIRRKTLSFILMQMNSPFGAHIIHGFMMNNSFVLGLFHSHPCLGLVASHHHEFPRRNADAGMLWCALCSEWMDGVIQRTAYTHEYSLVHSECIARNMENVRTGSIHVAVSFFIWNDQQLKASFACGFDSILLFHHLQMIQNWFLLSANWALRLCGKWRISICDSYFFNAIINSRLN